MNIPRSISLKFGLNLHNQDRHPIQIIKKKIQNFFGAEYKCIDSEPPIVSIDDNFDLLLIPPEHPSRSHSDTYYVDDTRVLRTHTSAHQNQFLKKGYTKFLVTGDVYRKDQVNRTHYPIFHQMEGVCLIRAEDVKDIRVIEVKNEDAAAVSMLSPATQAVRLNLLNTLSNLVEFLFPSCRYRFATDKFPFTHPSYEVEVEYKGKWLEILGCGVVQPQILKNCGHEGKVAWAFGLGLERLSMILFDIPDIRLFWSTDEKFLSQWHTSDTVQYVSYSTLDPLLRDLSFWVPEKGYEENDFFDLVREVTNDQVSEIERFDMFRHKNGRTSYSYHLTFFPNDDQLKLNSEFKMLVFDLLAQISAQGKCKMGLEFR
jgi:phenylalanyl-tRNA synthetase alpha chain